MKAYLVTTATIFALLAIAHAWRTIAEWPRGAMDPWFVIVPAIGALAAGLCLWAVRLLRNPR
jgi:hypothetical protein